MRSKRHFPSRFALLPILLAAASLTCSGDGVILPKEGEPANATVMHGNNQSGTVGTAPVVTGGGVGVMRGSSAWGGSASPGEGGALAATV